jgi:hypothetical protein
MFDRYSTVFGSVDAPVVSTFNCYRAGAWLERMLCV